MEEEFLEKIGKKALEYDKLSGCSQSVLLALQEAFNIGNLESFKSASVLSGGVARNGETCGALIGGLMAIGLVIGREKMENLDAYVRAINIANEIREKFKNEIKRQFNLKGKLRSTLCREIQRKIYGKSFNLKNPNELNAFLQAGGHSDDGCPKICYIAARVVAEKLLELKDYKDCL